MNYLKSLLINFLVVFFADHLLPGIDVLNQSKLPHIGGDLLMAIGLGILNTLIYPVLKLIGSVSAFKIALFVLVLNFAAYGVVKFISIGIDVIDIEGYVIASAIVSIGSFFTNFLEFRRDSKNSEMSE